jgi:hypothetical protein
MSRIVSRWLLGMLVFVSILSQVRAPRVQWDLYLGKWLLAALLLMAVVLAIVDRRGPSRLRPSGGGISLAFVVWGFSMALSLLNDPHAVSGALVLSSYVVLFLLTFLLIPKCIAGTPAYLGYNKAVLWGTVLALGLSIILGLNDTRSFYIVGTRVRYQAFFMNPNYLGLFALTGTLASCQLYAMTSRNRYLVGIFPLLLLLCLSGSRASMVAAVVAGAVMVCLGLRARSSCRTRMLLGATLYAVLGSLLLLGGVVVYIATPAELNDLTSLRWEYWLHVMTSLRDVEWILGRGLGRADLGIGSLDGYFVASLTQTGILGLGTLLVFLLSVVGGLWRRLRETPVDAALRVSAASLAALVVYSLFESSLFSLGSVLSIYVWMNIGCQLAKRRPAVNEHHRATTPRLGMRWGEAVQTGPDLRETQLPQV